MAIKKSDLYSSIWASCDELRGGMDASQYKDYVLFMLFIKYVSDKSANFDGFGAPIEIPPGASFTDMVALKGDADLGNKINEQIIQRLVQANSSRLARSDFPDFNDPNKLGDGDTRVQRLGNLIAIFENPALDFANNRAEHDDILGDAYEYLMRHFATESGKSKGQFYTPAEVSRVIAKVLGIGPHNSTAKTTAYDPTCGSGSLLLKVAAEAGKRITLEGQEKDSTTAGLARMNMILHGFAGADIQSGGEGTLVKPRFLDGEQLRTYDYVVANPPFSDKAWSTGLTLGDSGKSDRYERFPWGVPPKKQGDYAYLLHIVRSMKATGKGACILPLGVLFRGNAEVAIREQLVRSGILKGIIGLPANLFYGTSIPACILVLDKENAATRTGVFMIDASKDCRKDGNKNRLRDQDIHKIVDTFRKQDESNPRYARMVSFEEIAGNLYNLNLPRYIDSTEPEDVQNIDGHLRGGIPERDVNDLADYWQVMPKLRQKVFEPLRAGYARIELPLTDLNRAILEDAQFTAFQSHVSSLFANWRDAHSAEMKSFGKDGHPKVLIEQLSERLLAAFKDAPLLAAYDIYQHFMDYCEEALQDDAYLIASLGWLDSAKPRELKQVKNKEGKLTWMEEEDYKLGKRRFKSDLVPARLVVDRYFIAERGAIAALEAELAALEQQLDERREEHGGEDGLLAEAIEGESDKQRITAKGVRNRLKAIGDDPDYAEERAVLSEYEALLLKQAGTKGNLKARQEDLDGKLSEKYSTLTEDEVKSLVVDDKWLATLDTALQGELERVSQTLTGRIRQLAERYVAPLPQLIDEVDTLAARVDEHLKNMGAAWS